MNCAFDKEKLSGYFDGELSAAEKAEVERHIASCSECLRELGELKSAALLVKELPRLRAPRSVAENVSREIRTPGKVHGFASFRRNILWATAAAAALLVGVNVMYFSQVQQSAPLAQGPDSMVAPIARMERQQRDEPAAAMEQEKLRERRSAAPAAEEADRAPGELRKNTFDKLGKAEDAAKKSEKAPEAGREKAATPVKGAEGKPALDPQSAPVPAAPPAPAKPAAAPSAPATTAAPAPAPAPKEEPKPLVATKELAMKKDGENVLKAETEAKAKRAMPAEPSVEPPATHLTLASTQLSKVRPQMEEALKKMGIALPVPPPPQIKAPRPVLPLETTYTLELTDAQIARLRQEMEKQGGARLVVGRPDDPILAQLRGGLFGGRKDVASGGAAGKPAPEPPKDDRKDKDAKEQGAAPAAARALGESLAENSTEPRRKVVLHLMEVAALPDRVPAGEPVRK